MEHFDKLSAADVKGKMEVCCGNCKHIAEKFMDDKFRMCQRFEYDDITEDEAYIESGDFAASSAELWVKDSFYCKFFELKLTA